MAVHTFSAYVWRVERAITKTYNKSSLRTSLAVAWANRIVTHSDWLAALRRCVKSRWLNKCASCFTTLLFHTSLSGQIKTSKIKARVLRHFWDKNAHLAQ